MKLDALDFLPDNLKTNDVMLKMIDCVNSLISREEPSFESIEEAYYDGLYKTRDFSRLSYEAKIEFIKELGFGYITEIIELTNDQLTQLLVLFNVIYIFKGKQEGMELVLNTLNLAYTYTKWDEEIPTGEPFTAKLEIVADSTATSSLTTKLRQFVESYMLPYIYITIKSVVNVPSMYMWAQSVGIQRIRVRDPFNVTVNI